MTELQIGLLILGVAVIALVYGFNEFQVWRVRKKIRQNFAHDHDDVLLNVPKNHVRDGQRNDRLEPVMTSQHDDADDNEQPEPTSADGWQPLGAAKDASPVSDNELPPIHADGPALSIDIAELPLIELPWLDPELDFIADLVLNQPLPLKTLPRFTTTRRVKIAGCTTQGRWQLAEALPGIDYIAYRMGLQRVDRNGAFTEHELITFSRQVAQFAQVQDAEVSFPPKQQQLQMAQQLDAFCAEVDVLVGIHILFDYPAEGDRLMQTLQGSGFTLEPDGTFHYQTDDGYSLYTLSAYNQQPFNAQMLPQQQIEALTLLFDVPRVAGGVETFDHALGFAHALIHEFPGELVDDNRRGLSDQGLLRIREQLKQIYQRMDEHNIEPGGEVAQRLFA